MDEIVDNIINLDYDEIEEYKFPLDEPFGLKVNKDNVEYNFIIKFSRNNKNLICCSNGAHLRTKKTSDGKLIKPPYFDRWSWYKYFEESFIAFSDPTFLYDDKIRLGWFVGTKKTWYLEVVSEIIEKLAKNQKIINENILFFASSGGGFVSVGLATLLRGSKCFVINSQFSVLNYYKGHVNDLFKILKKEYRNLNEEEIYNIIPHRLNMIELFKKEKYIPPITYYANICSKSDLNNHAVPFINEVTQLPYLKNELNINFYYDDTEKPHLPLNTKETLEILGVYINENLYNDDSVLIFDDLKFDLPSDYKILSRTRIVKDSITLQFTRESHEDLDRLIRNYVSLSKKKGNTPSVSSFYVRRLKVHKIKISKASTLRYWFNFDGKIYQIYSVSKEAKDRTVDADVKFLIRSMIKNYKK